jgi:hypothetical protein
MPQRPPEAFWPNLQGRLLRAGLLGSDGVLGDPEADNRAHEDRARLPSHEFPREDGAESGSSETEQAAEDSRASSSLSPGSLPGFFESLFEAATSLGAAAVLALVRRAVSGRRVPRSTVFAVSYPVLVSLFSQGDTGGLPSALRRGVPGRHVPLNRFLAAEQLSVTSLTTASRAGTY